MTDSLKILIEQYREDLRNIQDRLHKQWIDENKSKDNPDDYLWLSTIYEKEAQPLRDNMHPELREYFESMGAGWNKE